VEPLLLVADLIGVFAFAVSGNLLAARKDIDILGSLVLGMAVGLGGGIMRDVILGRLPASLEAPIYLIPPVLSTVLVYFVGQRVRVARGPIVAFDALGLGVFVTTGTTIGMAAGVPTASAILLGVLTGVGGGMIRDVLANEIPAVFNSSDLYILPAVAGAATTALVWQLGWYGPWWTVGIAVLVFAFRMVAWWFEWRVPLTMRGWSYSSVRQLPVFRRPGEGRMRGGRRYRGVFAPRRRKPRDG
jgi:uncharacterized membrane protein YeiH